MSTDHNRIKVADLEKNQPDKILKTNSTGELEFRNISDIQVEVYNALDYTNQGKVLDARQGKVLKDLIDTNTLPLATDTETQISASVTEDKKVVSRLKLFNWWTWIKSQAQTISANWTFNNNLQVNGTITANSGVNANNVVVNSQLDVLDTSLLHKLGNENFTGIKSSTNTGATQINGISLTNNGTSGSRVLSITNTSTGRGIEMTNTGTGSMCVISNLSTVGAGMAVVNNSIGIGIVLDSTTASTGSLFEFRKNGVNTTIIDQNGLISATNTGTTQVCGATFTNNGTGNSRVLRVNNTSSGYGLSISNNDAGVGIHVGNIAGGAGILVDNTSTGASFRTNNNSTGAGAVFNSTTTSTGNLFVFQKNAVNTTVIDQNGVITTPNIVLTGIPTAPTAVAGTNTTQIATTAFVTAGINTLNGNVLHTLANESFGGIKNSVNTGATQINGISLTNNGSSGSNSFLLTNNGGGIGQTITNGNIGIGSYSTNLSTGPLSALNSQTVSTGDLLQFRKNNVTTSKFDQNGLFSAINSGTSLVTGISLTNNGTTTNAFSIGINNTSSGAGISLVNSGASGIGLYLQNTVSGAFGFRLNNTDGTGFIMENIGINGTLGVLNSQTASTGDLLRFQKNGTTTSYFDSNGMFNATNSSSTQVNGIVLINSGVASGQVLSISNTSTGNGSRTTNTGTGIGQLITNNATGNGQQINNLSTGNGLAISNSIGGYGLTLSNNGVGTAQFFTNSSSGVALAFNSATESTGDLIRLLKNNIITTRFDQNGILTTPDAVLTGIPTAPTAAAGTNTTQLATTAFVNSSLSGAVLTTGNQVIKGQKEFDDTFGGNATAIQSIKSNTYGTLVNITTGFDGAGGTLLSVNSVNGNASTNVAKLLVLNSGSLSSGMPFSIQNGGVDTYTIDKTGIVNGIKTYYALISQSGTSAPTVTILGKNSIGSIAWTRTAAGSYVGTLTGAFTANKTLCTNNTTSQGFVLFQQATANTVTLVTQDSTGTNLDGRLTNTTIKIEVYP